MGRNPYSTLIYHSLIISRYFFLCVSFSQPSVVIRFLSCGKEMQLPPLRNITQVTLWGWVREAQSFLHHRLATVVRFVV